MRLGKVLGVALVVLDFLTPAGPGFFQGDSHARAASVPLLTGPQDTSQMNGTINGVIINLNAILSPLTGGGLIAGTTPGSGVPAVNTITLIPAVSGSTAVIGIAPGGDANASIQIQPNGAGDIILFGSGNSGGNLVFSSQSMWVPATGLTACPGMTPGDRANATVPLGYVPIVTGYWVIEDWLDRQHLTVACG
jgi:hypothetical protein